MKIQGSDIEFEFEREEFHNEFHCCFVLRFINTPRGRLKRLIAITESFDTGGKLRELDFDFNGAKTVQERRKLLSALIRGPFKSQVQFDSKTLDLLKLESLNGVETLFLRFA